MATSKLCRETSLNDRSLNINKATFIVESKDLAILHCNECNSYEIVETIEGYVCRDCGLVLECQKLEYHRPYNDDNVQYARMGGTTQIGTAMERHQLSNSIRLERLNKLQSIKSNEKSVLETARIEISRIFNCLNLPESFKEFVFAKFKKVRVALKPGTKYRSPEKLVPIVIYFSCKLNNMQLKEKDLLSVAKINEIDFNAFKLQIGDILPEYKKRNRKKIIFQKILGFVEDFDKGMPFYYMCKKIIDKFWPIINNTKDDVIAGLGIGIVALVNPNYKKEGLSINTICKELDIEPSTIHTQVKKKIFERFNLPKFDTLVRSRDVLRDFLIKIGLIGGAEEVSISMVPVSHSPDIVEIKLEGTAIQTFNYFDTDDYYFYIMRDPDGYPMFVSKTLDVREINIESEEKNLENGKEVVELTFKWFSPAKGPPVDVV